MKESLPYLACSKCGKVAFDCDFCGKTFNPRDKVYCAFCEHFCSEKCMKRHINFLVPSVIELVDNNDKPKSGKNENKKRRKS
jgi:hypothetical protein